MSSFIENEINRLKAIKDKTQEEVESLAEYEGRLISIEAEKDYLNGN